MKSSCIDLWTAGAQNVDIPLISSSKLPEQLQGFLFRNDWQAISPLSPHLSGLESPKISSSTITTSNSQVSQSKNTGVAFHLLSSSDAAYHNTFPPQRSAGCLWVFFVSFSFKSGVFPAASRHFAEKKNISHHQTCRRRHRQNQCQCPDSRGWSSSLKEEKLCQDLMAF